MASSPRVDELRKKFDENPRRYFAPLANEYRKAGDFIQAIAICREYLPQQPGHMSGHIVFGQALYEARQFDEAKSVFETALSLDPENLIALKHLGDIALIMGDSESARGWYKKILDADPRNEEILAQIAKLEEKAKGVKVGATMVMAAVPRPGTPPKAPKPTPAGVAPVAAPPVAKAPAPASVAAAPTAEPPAPPKPSPAAPAAAPTPVTAESPTAEIRLDTIPTHAPPTAPPPVEMALGLEPTSMGDVGAQHFGASPTLEIDTAVSASKEAPPAGSFSLEGLETTSLTTDEAPPAIAAPPAPPAPHEAPSEGLVDLDISIPAAPAVVSASPTPAAEPEPGPAAEMVDLDFAPPPAPAAPAPVAPPAEVIDLDFAAPAAASPPAAPTPVERAAAEPSAAPDDLPLLDLGGAESAAASPPPATPVAEHPASEPEPVDVALEMPAAAPMAEAAPTAPDTSGAFVTETMAALYLQQGHRDEALRVYQALLERNPGDAALQAKVASLMPRAPAAPAEPATASVPPVRTGPTIRELLNVIALRRPGFRPEPPANGNGVAPHASASRLGADALAYLFGGSEVSPMDDVAAMALAVAFIDQDGHPDTLLVGTPAHPAQNDLSLNTVFPGESAPPPTASNFSFDQFFSRRATSEHATQAGGDEHVPESKEDVAQFTHWLEGLKQK